MGLLEGQQQVSAQFPMPVDVVDAATSITQVTNETVNFIVAETNINDAGSAAGTIVYGRLTCSNVLDSAKIRIGDYADSSLTFSTGTCLTTQKPFPAGSNYERFTLNGSTRYTKMQELVKGFSNGEYVVDHRNGIIIGKKATTATSDNASYAYRSSGVAAQTLASPYPANAVPVVASSGSVANANAVATLSGVSGYTTYISGFTMCATGAAVAAVVTPTVTGVIGGVTLSYTVAAIAGVNANLPTVNVSFPYPIPASATNTSIVVTLPALGAGNTNATVSAYGFRLPS